MSTGRSLHTLKLIRVLTIAMLDRGFRIHIEKDRLAQITITSVSIQETDYTAILFKNPFSGDLTVLNNHA